MNYRETYEKWINDENILEQYRDELRSLTDEKDIEDRFYQELKFGTAGLRGILGAGTNRMNEHTVGKATAGLAMHLKKTQENPSVVIAYDSRIKSDVFAKVAAQILAYNNIKVYLFNSLRPVPMLSFAVRELKASSGIVITASHNPKEYNGYKVYASYGGQITDEEAESVLKCISSIHDYSEIKLMDFNEAVSKNLIEIISDEIDNKYYESIEKLTIRKDLVSKKAKDLKIIYTPIHGSGNIPVRQVLKNLGYSDVTVVQEQELPDGNFPTTDYPNPENKDVFNLALKLNEKVNADIIFATDPDADRLGVVVFDKDRNMQVLTGNQTGMLLTNYILSSLKEEGKLPANGAVIKTVVTTDSVRNIAEKYNITVMEVLTGFKYIGEKIEEFNATGKNKYIFGFEESYGYLIGEHARDKDAVVTSMMVCEMALYYKSRDMSLYEGLMEVYNEFGYFNESIKSITLPGKDGQEKIKSAFKKLRDENIEEINGVKVISREDFLTSKKINLLNGESKDINLPKSNVLKYRLEDESWFVIRPSGTEPKIKIYLAVKGESLEDSNKQMESFKEKIESILDEALK